jgi:hypothetical protein
MRPVDFFHIGPQKAATTWVYHCLREHPQIATSPAPEIHYFDMFYARGREWYARFFEAARPDQILFDPTYTYIRSPLAPSRIATENPAARMALCLRDPIERAFSHYWHERKKGVIRYEFADVVKNYDLFATWLEPGFYAQHLARYLEHFPREQILCQRYEHLRENPRAYLDELLAFAGVEQGFEPSVLHKEVNPAGPSHSFTNPGYYLAHSRRFLERVGVPRSAIEAARARIPALRGRAEYERGVAPELRRTLLGLIEPEIAALEELLGDDFSAWRRP